MGWSPHQSPYALFWCGQWRPITWMCTSDKRETTDPTRATAVVICLGPEGFTAEAVHPGEVVRHPEPGNEFLTVDEEGDLTPNEHALG